jgi:hypothetical protein
MAVPTEQNPFGIDPARDMHHEPPRTHVPFWSENLLFTGVDSENGIFFYHHWGSVADAQDQWRGDFAVALPDGRQLLQVTFGNECTGSRISDGTLVAECIEPLKSWRIRFDSVAYLTDAETNRNHFLSVEQEPVRCSFDIRWEGYAPMHEAKRGEGLTTGFDVRYEQGGTYWGHVEFKGERHELRGYGYRDHSVGPRQLSKFTGHVWHWGTFPSGRVFGSLNMDEGEKLLWKAPYVVLDGALIEGEYVSGPYWGPGRDDFNDRECELVLRAAGTEHRIHGEFMDYGYYWTCWDPMQLCFGMDPKRMVADKHWITREVVVKWDWDGEEALGLIEISRRLGD